MFHAAKIAMDFKPIEQLQAEEERAVACDASFTLSFLRLQLL